MKQASATGPARGDQARGVNVGDLERVGSVAAGTALVLWGLRRAPVALAALGAGGVLLWRGFTGHCNVYAALGKTTAPGPLGAREGNLGVKVDRSITVHAPADRLYGFWRNFENLPRIMSHVDRVETLSDTRSRWTVKTLGGMPVQWEAEIVNDHPFDVVAWRTVGDAVVRHAGSVRFEALGPDTTRVDVSLQYEPPGGELGHALAALFDEDAGHRVEQDLAEFKRAMETHHRVA